MSNIWKWLSEASEPIQWVILGDGPETGNSDIDDFSVPMGKLLSFIEAKAYLDVPFFNQYGSRRIRKFYAWSENFVYFPVSYDGEISLHRMPRNPISVMPVLPLDDEKWEL